MAVYICMCGFCFELAGDVERCSDCGSANVRYATDAEAAEYRRNKAEDDRDFAREKKMKVLDVD